MKTELLSNQAEPLLLKNTDENEDGFSYGMVSDRLIHSYGLYTNKLLI